MSSSQQQHQEQEQQLEGAIRTILSSNFDADSKVCFVTLLKVIDNILQKPGNDKVRSLRTENQAIKTKIVDKGGHHFLLACGFVLCRDGPGINSLQMDEKLVLHSASENTALLIQARHALAKKAVHELGMTAGDLPIYKPPKATTATTSSSSSSSSPAFDVYKGRRFDAQSAAAGANLGAPDNWKSKTEQDLEVLKQREAKLQRQMAAKNATTAAAFKKAAATTTTTTTTMTTTTKPIIDRHWTVFLPGQLQPPQSLPRLSSAVAMANSTALKLDSSSSSSKGDSKLLANHFQQQHAKRVASENRGFTTKAMRDLEKLKKTKIYSHTQLAIHFPDGVSLRANFSTTERLSAVIDGLRNEVLFSTTTLPLPDFELYQTPPRRVLDPPSATLKKLGLVPAAKIYLGWKQALRKLEFGDGMGAGWYIRPELLRKPPPPSSSSSMIIGTGTAALPTGPILPTSVPVLRPIGGGAATATNPAKRKKTKAEKEAALMKRMLGKK